MRCAVIWDNITSGAGGSGTSANQRKVKYIIGFSSTQRISHENLLLSE